MQNVTRSSSDSDKSTCVHATEHASFLGVVPTLSPR